MNTVLKPEVQWEVVGAVQSPLEEELIERGHRVATVIIRRYYVYRGQTISALDDNKGFELAGVTQINANQIVAEFIHLGAVPTYTLRVTCDLVQTLKSPWKNRAYEAANANDGEGVPYKAPRSDGLMYDHRIPLPESM